LLHYSTDYVFDGSGNTAWHEDSPTGPLNVYGSTKLEGEMEIARLCTRHLILRTSWVYAARGGNFAKTMLRLAQNRTTLSVVDDQYGAPTGADWLADCSAHMLARVLHDPQAATLAGTYHAAAAGCTNWHGYASHVLALARQSADAAELMAEEILPVPTSSFPTPARRPANSRLDTRKLRETFGFRAPLWQAGVERMLKEIHYDPSR
jgi:dTDP-4-dehydrorhamnose reductase